MSVNHNLKVPAVFGRYILLRRMSRGGMGEIFLGKLGEIQGFEKPIVIKKILPDLAQDQEFLQRFVEEAQIAIKLTHGNIVPVYEVGMVDGEYFLALQYIEGRDLRSLINRCRERKQRMPPDLCLYLVREITNGLAYAHRKTDEAGKPLELVHCDISPPNILVSWEGEVKIIDFGIAKSAIQKAQADENIGFGKFGYMAPEQLIRGGTVDRRTDIYSTGVLLFELITGERLFNFPPGTDYRRVAREVTAGKIGAPSERDFRLGDQFDPLVLRALRTERDERYTSAEEFRDAVQQQLYSMNPTISADALAAFVRDLFAEEIDEERQMLSSLSQTDMEPFRSELNDATSHTVSYALAGLWNGGGAAAARAPTLEPPATSDRVRRESGARDLSGDSSAPGGTRRLEEGERQVALQSAERSVRSYTVLVQQRRRTVILVAATLGVLISIGVGLGLLLREGAVVRPGPARPAGDGPAVVGSALDLQSVAASRPAPDQGLPGDSDTVLTFAPEPVEQSDGGVTVSLRTRDAGSGLDRQRPRRRNRRIRRRPPVRHKKAKPPPKISAAVVQRKFREVRKEYGGFKRAYGHQLDDEWQKILFANTYGNMDEDKYRRLNAMLDAFRSKMKRARGE